MLDVDVLMTGGHYIAIGAWVQTGGRDRRREAMEDVA